jgi:hypothetical protein
MPTEKHQVRAVRCDVYSRICGYFTSTNVWNIGKKEEFKMRAVLSNMDIERAVNNDERSGTIETNE